MRDDARAADFGSDDDLEGPEPVELVVFEDGTGRDLQSLPHPLLDELPELESSACAVPVPPASVTATPKVTAPTPSHPWGSRRDRLARWAPLVRCLDVEALTCLPEPFLLAIRPPRPVDRTVNYGDRARLAHRSELFPRCCQIVASNASTAPTHGSNDCPAWLSPGG